jgi:hypothetical protein
MFTCASGLLRNPAKVPSFEKGTQEFHNDSKKFQAFQFWASTLHWPTAMVKPKSQNFKIILDPWPRSPGFGPWRGPSPMNIRFSEHNLSSCYQKWTCDGSFERSQHQECFLYWTHGHLRLWLTPQSDQSPKISKLGMMVFCRLEISWWWWKNRRISILRLGSMAHGHNPAKVPKFKYKAWWYSIDRKFHADDK